MAKESFFKRLVRHMHLNNLGLVWYCLLTTCLQVYIIVRSIYRFTAYVTLPWPNGTPPVSSINVYLLFIGCSILLLPIFILTALFKIGNFSNDGRKFGALTLRLPLFEQQIEQVEQKQRGWCTLLWRHLLPIAPILHLFMSFCFLFPRLITESQLIRHGYLSKADIWKTDLDFLLKRFNGKSFNFFGLIHTITQYEYRSTFAITNNSTYFLSEANQMAGQFAELNDAGKLSLEYLNFILALLILTIRYPAVFWRTNKQFSLMFSSLLVMNAVQSIANLAAFQVTFKVFVCDPTQMLLRYREFSSLTLTQLCLLFIIYLVLVHLSSTALYVFGVQKYREYRLARTKQMQDKYEDKTYLSYLPYLMAMIFFLFFSIIFAPIFYEFIIIYCGSLNTNCLVVIITSIAYIVFWILLWVGIGLKNRWTFEYDDIESPNFGGFASGADCLLIISNGKSYKIFEDASKQAILSFARSKLSSDDDNEQNSCLYGRFESAYDFGDVNTGRQLSEDRFNQNYRYSTISHRYGRKKRTERYNPYDVSDSEGDYTSFQRVRRSSSFRQQKPSLRNIRTTDQVGDDNLYGTLSFQPFGGARHEDGMRMTNNITYGLSGVLPNKTEMATRKSHPDKVSDTSSGIHSQSSDASLSAGKTSPDLERSSSLESILQRLEAAAASKPCLRSLSPIQQSIDLLNQMDVDARPTMPKMSSFPQKEASSKLSEFVSNPEYNRYYSADLSVV